MSEDRTPDLFVTKAFTIYKHSLPAPMLAAYRVQLEQKRIEKVQENLENKLGKVMDEQPMAQIIVPLLLQRLKEDAGIIDSEPAYKETGIAKIKDRFHPRYANLQPDPSSRLLSRR